MIRPAVQMDIVSIRHVIVLAKRAAETEKAVYSKLTKLGAVHTLAEAAACYNDPENNYVRADNNAKTALESYLLTLPYETVCDIWALMYLGRNGQFDGVEIIPVHERIPLYRNDSAGLETDELARHIAGKSPLLAEYLQTGLRLAEL